MYNCRFIDFNFVAKLIHFSVIVEIYNCRIVELYIY